MLWTLIIDNKDKLETIDCTGPHGTRAALNHFSSEYSSIIAIIPGCHAKYTVLPSEEDHEEIHLSARK